MQPFLGLKFDVNALSNIEDVRAAFELLCRFYFTLFIVPIYVFPSLKAYNYVSLASPIKFWFIWFLSWGVYMNLSKVELNLC